MVLIEPLEVLLNSNLHLVLLGQTHPKHILVGIKSENPDDPSFLEYVIGPSKDGGLSFSLDTHHQDSYAYQVADMLVFSKTPGVFLLGMSRNKRKASKSNYRQNGYLFEIHQTNATLPREICYANLPRKELSRIQYEILHRK